jgi:class 3 adenylate cyclase
VNPRVRYAKTGSVNLAYQVVGDGPVDLVLSPGWVTHLDLAWDIPQLARLLRRLASFSRLILFDKRGTGLSDRVSSEDLPTLEQRMDDIHAVMDAAGSERAVLFGTLGGGAMCGLFAASNPERSIALILYGTFGRLEPDTGLLSRLAGSEEAALDRIEREWGTDGVGVAFWAPSLVDDEPARDAYLRLSRSSVSPGSARALMQLGYQVNWEAVLPAIRVPTLVLHRSGDLVVPVRQGRKLAEGIPHARFIELPGVDHLMWAGDQDAVVEEVRRFLAEVHPRAAGNRVLATILFTDIAGSTEALSRMGDHAWRDLLAEHRRSVRSSLAAFGGNEVDTAGDGFVATFQGPARAIECASTILDETESLGIQVRAGIHTGECEVSDDGITGVAVHVAARVMAGAEPGQILVSKTVKELVAGSGIRFEDRGPYTLKGVPGEWDLFAVRLPLS